MADEPRIIISSEPSLGADEVARRTFATSFRGYDTAEVRAFLRRVADEIGSLREREAELRRRLEESQRAASTPPPLDEAALTAALGEETARVLRSAREAAAEITRKAEQKVAAVVREAQEQAARLREEAEGLLARRTEEAEKAAAALRAEAEADADAIRARARAEAEAFLEEARATAREMVQEAQALRERVLADLARRRRLAQVHVEQLRAGRERLLDAYRLVRRTLDEVTDELGRAEVEARAAAEEAGRRAAAEAGTTLQDLEAELTAMRDQLAEPAGGTAETAAAAERPAAAETAGAADAGDDSAPVEPASGWPEAGGRSESPPDAAPTRTVANGGGEPLAVLEPPDEEEGVRVLRGPSREDRVADAGSSSAPEEAGHDEALPSPPAASTEPEAHRSTPADADADGRLRPAPAPSDVDALFARIRADRERAVAEAAAVLASGAVPEGEASPVTEGPEDETPAVGDGDESLLQRRDELLEPLEATLVRRLKRVLQDEQNAVLDALRTRRGVPAVEDLLPDPAAQAEPYRREAAAVLDEAAGAGAVFAGGSLNGAAAVAIEPAAVDLAGELVSALRERVARALAAAAGEGVDAVEPISSAYREWRLQRIEPAARHAVSLAFALGSFAVHPPGAALRWVVDDEGRPCPDCDDNALAGPTPKGEPFPTGQLHPPAHPGCRCLLVPAEG